jgi:hypothetical protein
MPGEELRPDVRITGRQHLADLRQRHPEFAEPVDHLRGRDLLAGVVAVA